MNYNNPTRLSLGMTGQFNGTDYKIVGRSVLGESEGGEIYYWNEFNLETDSGKEATLVFEQTDNGNQWRIFTLFDPEYPMTAADAAGKRVGDRINLTGDNVRVTFRGKSRVYYVQGKAPEGEDVDSVAEYFNCEGSGRFQVVSWTGDEVEFYNGVTLTYAMIASAFGQETGEEDARQRVLSSLSSYDYSDSTDTSHNGVKSLLLLVVFVIMLAFLVFHAGFSYSADYERKPVQRTALPASPLELGAQGTLFDKHYHVTSHASVGVAEVGADWGRHEYELTDDSGATALLVCGEKPGGDWALYEDFAPMIALTAKEAATKKAGDALELDGYTGKVDDLLLFTIEQVDGGTNGSVRNGTMLYGFTSANEYRRLLCRWNDAGIQYFRGRSLSASKGAAGFAAK